MRIKKWWGQAPTLQLLRFYCHLVANPSFCALKPPPLCRAQLRRHPSRGRGERISPTPAIYHKGRGNHIKSKL